MRSIPFKADSLLSLITSSLRYQVRLRLDGSNTAKQLVLQVLKLSAIDVAPVLGSAGGTYISNIQEHSLRECGDSEQNFLVIRKFELAK
jgi:hypothetical protein